MSLRVEHLDFSYGGRPVLRDVSFAAGPGQFLSVLGPNGVGKSTLFRCLLGLLTPERGAVLLEGRPVGGLPPRQRARLIAFIPQSHQPVFHYTVREMVLMGVTARLGPLSSPGRDEERLVEDILERLGIASLAGCGYASISGGERQLTLIARALAQQARILVMDEPTASLDLGNRIRVMEVVRALVEKGYCVIQSTHDPEQAYRCSDRVLALCEGRVLAFGPPGEVIQSPLISRLYGEDIRVCSLLNDAVRVCVPPSRHPDQRKER